MTSLESKSQKADWMNSGEEPPQSINLNTRKSLIRRLRKSLDARIRFVESHLNKKLAFQIRGLRGELSQEQMEQRVGIKQQVLSRLENPYYGKATLTTLKKIAAACDVGLLVEFVPFSQLIKRASGTPYVEYGYSPETMNVPSFDQEEEQNSFEPEDSLSAFPSHSEQSGSEMQRPFDLSGRPPGKGKVPTLPFLPPPSGGLGPNDQIRMGGSDEPRRI